MKSSTMLSTRWLAPFFAVALLAIAVAACTSTPRRDAPVERVTVTAPKAPPPPLYEPVPAPRGDRNAWMPGYWTWESNEFRWIPGRYDARRDNARWVPPHWRQRDNGQWDLIEGHWQSVS